MGPQSMAILRGLQEKGTKVADPTSYIKAAVQRANGVRVASSVKQETGGDDMGEEEEANVEFGAEEDAAGEEPMQEDEADELAEGMEPEEEENLEGLDFGVDPTPRLRAKAEIGEKRVIGGLTGYKKLAPTRAQYESTQVVADGDDDNKTKKAIKLPPTPQEKLVQVRDLALKHSLHLDQACLKGLARLPYNKARDLITEVLLGGWRRTGVKNPSRYLTIAVEKTGMMLGVEQGIAMELAVSLGVVLNNEALDELACIPRKEAHSIIRELARNAGARQYPIRFIQNEVMKCRAQYDARPWPPKN